MASKPIYKKKNYEIKKKMLEFFVKKYNTDDLNN